MPVKVPNASNYMNPLVSVFARWQVPPTEGPRMIQCEIPWGTDGGPNNSVNVNLSNNAVLNFSQIVALSVDNSQCGADIVFYATDTQETLTIPAYSPKSICPFFTNQTQFNVFALGEVLSSDVTRFSIHNSVPPPISISVTQEQNLTSVGPVDMGTAATQVIGTTVNGTLENIHLNMAVNAANSGNGTWNLTDGASKLIAQGAVSFSAGNKYNISLYDADGINVRFSGGLVLNCTETAVLGSLINVNLYFRTP